MYRRRHGLRCVLLQQFPGWISTWTPHSRRDGVERLPSVLPRAGFPAWTTHIGQRGAGNWTKQTHCVLNIREVPEKVTLIYRQLSNPLYHPSIWSVVIVWRIGTVQCSIVYLNCHNHEHRLISTSYRFRRLGVKAYFWIFCVCLHLFLIKSNQIV